MMGGAHGTEKRIRERKGQNLQFTHMRNNLLTYHGLKGGRGVISKLLQRGERRLYIKHKKREPPFTYA